MSEPAQQLKPSLIDADVSRAWTLPSDFYTDPAQLEREREFIFARTWQVVGFREQVANAGDYFTCELAGEPLLIARDQQRRLRGFYNVCRHRAGPPAEGCGSRKLFRCGYHGWTYGLDGHLISAPEFEGVENFRPQEFGLTPICVEEWSGLIFANLASQPEPLLSALRELPGQLARFCFERMRFFERRDYIMECNWKTYIDNYLEGYHLPSVHPGLNRELDYGSYITERYPRHSRQASPIRGAENAGDAPRRYQQATGAEMAEYFWIFPNWMLNCYPDNVSLNVVLPLAPERCVAIFEWFFPDDVLTTDAPGKTVKFSDEIQIEDGAICEKVQRNLHSRSYRRGRYSVKQEQCLHHFHRLYCEFMNAG